MTDALIPPLVSEGQVLAHVNGCLGLITLNRPQALNALTLPMVRDITMLLHHWERHPTIQAVALLGTHREGKPTAFCAGGDIRFFYHAALARDPDLDAFFTEEYALVHRIHTYPKPTIALMDGIVMGGGMGLSQGTKLRVVNEHSQLAMPECRIGLFPDVGGGYFLGRCPGSTGEWLALTGQSLGAGDAINVGLADVFVPASSWNELVHALCHDEQRSAEHVVATIMERAELAPEPRWQSERAAIDRCFGKSDLRVIKHELRELSEPWSDRALVQMAGNSPLAMDLSLRLLHHGRVLTLEDELRLERILVHWCFAPSSSGEACDALEGIRAISIDKDLKPTWRAPEADAWSRFSVSPWHAEHHPLRALRPACA